MEYPIIISFFILLLALIRVVTAVVHELGHAVAGLILFRGEISVYIGSYGDPKKGIHFGIGRLKVHFKYNPFLWGHGLCTSKSAQMSFLQGYIFTLAGPLSSLIVGMASLYFLIDSDSHGALKLVSFFLLVSSLFDFFLNIMPSKKPILLYNGTLTYNDGQSLKLLNEYRHVFKEITLLSQHYNNNEIEKGIAFFEEAYSQQPDVNILRLGIALNMKGENYERAIALFNEFGREHKMRAEDYGSHALAYSFLGEHLEALELYDKSLQLNSEAIHSLCNRGYTLNVLERFEKAILDFDKAIELNPNFAYAYSNRGLAKIKLGQEAEGLNDIAKSIQLDDKEPYGYKNLGIYHKDKGDMKEALEFFLQAKTNDPKTDGLNELIEEAETQIVLSGDRTRE